MDKAQFIESFGELLTNISFGVSGAKYAKEPWEDTAVIEFHNREPIKVNVNGDSNAAIMFDVMRALHEQIGL